jgi:hypothetical protein
VQLARPGFRIDGERPRAATAPPVLSAEGDRLLTEFGYDAAARSALRAAGVVH